MAKQSGRGDNKTLREVGDREHDDAEELELEVDGGLRERLRFSNTGGAAGWAQGKATDAAYEGENTREVSRRTLTPMLTPMLSTHARAHRDTHIDASAQALLSHPTTLLDVQTEREELMLSPRKSEWEWSQPDTATGTREKGRKDGLGRGEARPGGEEQAGLELERPEELQLEPRCVSV
jgi:hypothetical protein